MTEPVRENQTALSLVELYGIDNDFLPCEIFRKVGNQLRVIQSAVRIQTSPADFNSCADRENTNLHDFVSDCFIGHGVDNLSEQCVCGGNHTVSPVDCRRQTDFVSSRQIVQNLIELRHCCRCPGTSVALVHNDYVPQVFVLR